MDNEPQPQRDGEPRDPKVRVTTEDFVAVEVEAPLRDSKNVDCWTLGRLYQSAASAAEERGSEPAARVFGLLAAIANIHFKPEDRAEPFGPQLVMDGRQSMVPGALKSAQTHVLADHVPAVRNPGLRARLADIAWHNQRTLSHMDPRAINAYCEAVRLVLDGQAEFFNEDRAASGIDGCKMLRRACWIAHATGWKDPEASRLRVLVDAVVADAIDRQDHRGFLNATEVALQFGIGDSAAIAISAETFAVSENIDPHGSHDLWELAARAYANLDNHIERDRCRIGAAESSVALADAAGDEGTVAAHFLMDAIQALRRLPDTKERRRELERRLRNAQTAATDEMGTISTEVDLSELVAHARRSVAGMPLAQALAAFVNLTHPPEPEALRDEALEQAERTPLSSMMPMSIVDEEGKVLSKSPGLFGDSKESSAGLHHLIARIEGFRRQCDVSGLIEPARRCIQVEHPLDQNDLRLLVTMSPFVPGDRADLFTVGFARFFGGDFISALHILVPQLENSPRHVLKLVGEDPSVIQRDMTQQNRTLSVMLAKDRSALEAVFGAAIVHEIENLFDFRGGPPSGINWPMVWSPPASAAARTRSMHAGSCYACAAYRCFPIGRG